ncbi:hypothetical protein Asi03nite_27310 [Actinoplanes siamensis]|uniref:Uncharacterized protein n=1 Tax=Actinoplanes siamensis TaxID=1223317 RepID=A0A919N6C9_9ACTN|nr:hypothetical protein Asi03nite_27310 [Actinoplanes siamensis]
MLADARLIAPPARGEDQFAIGVRCGRPLLYPADARDLPVALRSRAAATGARYLGALFAFDLDPAPAGYRYSAARFTVDLGDCDVPAVLVHAGADQFGLLADGAASPLADRAAAGGVSRLISRLRSRDDRPPAWTTGAQSTRFGWRYQDRRGTPLLPRTYGVHAVLEVTGSGRTDIAGFLEVEAELTGAVRRRASTRHRIPFAAPLPGAAAGRAAAVRLCMAADVVGYSRRPEAAERLQHDLVSVLADARWAAGVTAAQVSPQPQGDGQFTVLPAGLDESDAIPRLLRGLDEALRFRNAASGDEPMRLRLALHRGLVKEADNGWVGRAAVAVHRLLDSPPLRAAVADHPRADWVLGVPDVLYADVLATGTEPPPAAFQPVTVDLPGKGFREHAWLYVPGAVA